MSNWKIEEAAQKIAEDIKRHEGTIKSEFWFSRPKGERIYPPRFEANKVANELRAEMREEEKQRELQERINSNSPVKLISAFYELINSGDLESAANMAPKLEKALAKWHGNAPLHHLSSYASELEHCKFMGFELPEPDMYSNVHQLNQLPDGTWVLGNDMDTALAEPFIIPSARLAIAQFTGK